ncbi:MAG: hypothetical protein FD123_590 [Bacteroidetes bacterium]|nr:MAG: hypothetical protein FD123_590 [Bacteroidota bacterium]
MRLLLLSLFFPAGLFAGNVPDSIKTVSSEAEIIFITGNGDDLQEAAGHEAACDTLVPVAAPAGKIKTENRKLVAALLAVPPFGMLGLHRIYLGTKPYIPIVYLVTLGGGLGILPLIDLAVILLSEKEQLETFRDNPKIFMWMK